jgi:hypothetical protein
MTTNCFFFSTISFYIQYQPYNNYCTTVQIETEQASKNVSIFAWQKGQQPFFPAFSAGFFML